MHRSRYIIKFPGIAFFALVFLLFISAQSLALVICGSCGHEAEDGASFCSHCGAALAGAVSSAASSSAETAADVRLSDDAPDTIGASIEATLEQALARDVQAMRRAIETGHHAQAFFHAQNSKVLAAFLDKPLRPFEIADTKLLHEIDTRVLRCPLCEGRGRKIQPVIMGDGQLREQEVPGQACPMCGGSGPLGGHVTSEAFAHEQNSARRSFTERMRRWGRIPFGPAWIPELPVDEISIERQAAARRSVGSLCETCLGLGRFGCETCAGTGRRPCYADGCIMGRRVCPDCNGTRRERNTDSGRTLTRRCRTCGGLGIVDCDVCTGNGWTSCSSCDGRGTESCETCRGTGHKAICTRCEGSGLSECTRCRGSGEYRGAPCPYCRGVGKNLCKSCHGAGHR